jgi:hypothetical protein
MPKSLAVGDIMRWDGSLWVNATGLTHFDVVHYGATGDGVTDDTEAIQDAADAAGAAGGGIVLLPPGTYLLDSSAVAAHEGTAVTLGAGDSLITFRGSGRGVSVLKPASNKIEMFLQNEGTDIVFEDLTFDNSANGQLQSQTKPGTYTVAGGVAGYGNAANCAIRQVRGANLTVRRVDFHDFTCDVEYIGDFDDDQVLSGTVAQEDVFHDGCCFGLLASQPEYIFNTGKMRSADIVKSTNADLSEDPGHELYVTNRPGAHPKHIYIQDSYAENGHSSSIKIRKGETVEFGSITSYLCGRGPEIWGAKQITGGRVNSVLAEVDLADTNSSGLELTDCGPAEIGTVFVDVNGVNAWGVRVRASDPVAWSNANIRLSNVTVKTDNSGTTGKAAVIIEDQTDFDLVNFRLLHDGSTASTKYPVDVRDCTRARINRPSRIAPDAPSDAAWLVSFDVDCVDCAVSYSGQDLTTSATTATISNLGTDTSIVRVDPRTWGASAFTTYGRVERIEMVEHFAQTGDGLTGMTVAVSGTVAAGTISCDSGRVGVLDCAAGTDTTGRAGVQSGTACILFGSGIYRMRIDAQLVNDSDGTDTYIARLGFLDSVSAEPTDGVFFRYTHSVNSGNWVCVTRSNGSETPVNTAVNLSAGNYRTFEIEVNAAGTSAAFYIDGALVHTETATIPLGASRNTGYGAALIKSAGANSRSMRLDLLAWSFEPTAAL